VQVSTDWADLRPTSVSFTRRSPRVVRSMRRLPFAPFCFSSRPMTVSSLGALIDATFGTAAGAGAAAGRRGSSIGISGARGSGGGRR
jgi:hypothetical protein